MLTTIHNEKAITPSRSKDLSLCSMPVVLACLVLIVTNIWCCYSQPFALVDPESLPAAHTWVWWATRDFLQAKKSPQILLLGSSVMMQSIARQDANFLQQDFDYVHHHRSQYMEYLLAKRFSNVSIGSTITTTKVDTINKTGNSNGFSPHCFNYALPGSMVSDDYMVLQTALNKHRKPGLIILGLTVRDFMDARLTTPAATPIFKYLKRYFNVDNLVDLSMPQIWQRLDYWLGKTIYLYGKKLDFQTVLAERTRRMFLPFWRKHLPLCALTEEITNFHTPNNLRAEVEEGMFIVHKNQPYSFEDNRKEYTERYRNANKPIFDIECQFLGKFLFDCHKQGICVVLVKLPATHANTILLPVGVYDRYVNVLTIAARKWNMLLVEPEKMTNFSLADYYDTVHLNANGGRKLIDCIVKTIADSVKSANINASVALSHISGASK